MGLLPFLSLDDKLLNSPWSMTGTALQVRDTQSESESQALQCTTLPLAAPERQSQTARVQHGPSVGAEPGHAALQTGQQQ